MKNTIILLLLLLSSASTRSFEQGSLPSDKIIGTWQSETKDHKIEIYKQGNQFCGKLIWYDTMYEADGITVKKDSNNTDKNLRNRSVKDLVVLTGLTYQDGEWKDGKIYDVKGGKTWSCIIKLGENDRLKIKGYIGLPAFGKTMSYNRVK